MFSAHNGNKSEINFIKISLKSLIIWKFKGMPHNNPYVKEDITRKIRKY